MTALIFIAGLLVGAFLVIGVAAFIHGDRRKDYQDAIVEAWLDERRQP